MRNLRWFALNLAFLCFTLASFSQESVAAQEKPRYGGTLVVAVGSSPATLNSTLSSGSDVGTVACKIFNGLVWVDKKTGELHPELAKSWETSKDGLTYTIHLQENVLWHDGKPLTSEDVKFSLEEMLLKYHPRTRKVSPFVDRVDTPDRNTVIVRMKKPYAPFLRQMTCRNGAISPKHLYAGKDILKNPRNFDHPIGTGPFMFKEFIRGDHITLVRNPNFFRPGKPYLDRIIIKVIPDSAARVIALEKGEVDFVQSIFFPKSEYARLSKSKGFQHEFDTDEPADVWLHFNLKRKPLGDRRVRQALLFATDRSFMKARAAFGLGNMGRGPIDSRYAWAYNSEADYRKLYPFDPKRAEKLLDEAGYPRKKGGVRFTVNLIFMGAFPELPPSAEIIRSNWQDIGVKVNLERAERQVWIDKTFKKRDFDLAFLYFGTAGDPAIGISRVYTTNKTRRLFVNASGYSNPQVDELFAKAASSPVLAERGKHYKKVAKILARDLPTIVLLERGNVDFASEKFAGFWKSTVPYDTWDQIWWRGGREKP